MKRFFFFLFLFIGFISNAQDSDTTIVMYPDESAQFPGGAVVMKMFLAENIVYPKKALENNESGKVYIDFIIEVDGSLSNIRIIKGVTELLNNEALRVVDAMPKWIPARQRGRIVRSFFRIPISFWI